MARRFCADLAVFFGTTEVVPFHKAIYKTIFKAVLQFEWSFEKRAGVFF